MTTGPVHDGLGVRAHFKPHDGVLMWRITRKASDVADSHNRARTDRTAVRRALVESGADHPIRIREVNIFDAKSFCVVACPGHRMEVLYHTLHGSQSAIHHG